MRILLLVLILCGGVARAQTALSVPDGGKLILRAYARGVQVYVCTQDPKDTSRYVWLFSEPQASLYEKDNYRTQIGKHYYNPTSEPTWESTDGTIVSADKVQQAPAADTTAIPWLLLKVSSSSGYGPLRATTYVQRVNTHGGKPSAADANRVHKGQYIRVPYTAEYLFYGLK